MELDRFNVNDSKAISDILCNIDKRNFDKITEIIKNTFQKLGINLDDMLIYYQRHANSKSVLAIKVVKGDDNDIGNYIFCGCSVDQYKFCDVYMHAEAKSAQKGQSIINLISKDIVVFFESVEKDLSKKNLNGLEISLRISLGESVNQETGFKKLMKTLFKNK